jgi:hypothetical protein
VTAVQAPCSEQPPEVQLMYSESDGQDASFYNQFFDSWIYHYDKCLNR